MAKTMKNDDNGEIDKIMQEIEDLEKKMDETSVEAKDDASGQDVDADNVVNLRDDSDIEDAPTEETVNAHGPLDEVDAEDLTSSDLEDSDSDATPIRRNSSGSSNNGLSLHVGEVSNISLEFARHGMTVSLSCTDDGLVIKTDQGAEFRVPFKRAA